MGDLGIGDLTVGYSAKGATQYVEDLNAQAITETKNLLGNIDGIRTALEAGWVGQAERNYVANLQKAVEKVQGTLEELRKTLNGQFAEIEQNMKEIDDTIVPLQ